MKRVMITILVGIFLLNIILPSYTCEASDLLDVKEGFKYSYSGWIGNTDVYLTNDTDVCWEGLVVINYSTNDYTYLFRFKIMKEDFTFYETNYIRIKNAFNENVNYKKITSDATQSNIISIFLIPFVSYLYNFDMDALVETGSMSAI